MPQPVITGFAAGIAVSIFISQIKDALGLDIEHMPGEFLERIEIYSQTLGTFNPFSTGLTVGCLALIILLRRYRPNWPQFLLAVGLGSLTVALFAFPVPIVGSLYGEIPSALPVFSLPETPFNRTAELLPAALTIAFLGALNRCCLPPSPMA